MGINAIVKERHLLTHPFYVKWSQGKVSLETLQEYSKQYYHYEKALPSFLTAALQHIDDEPARSAVQEVLTDESSNPRPHADMWLDFAAGLGVSADEVKASTATCQTRNLVETYTSLCNRGQEEAIGALYAYESQQPEVAQSKADGLIAHYGVNSTQALAFFKLHAVLDIQHAKALRSALVDSELGRESAHLSLDAWWGMLDQFCH
ncbi:MAG TPA: iron-containing redox enzyme family protein [Actinomycetota bacterium]|nr:iron-containing redox enzyme family protein [Actinomycetota bacterium]